MASRLVLAVAGVAALAVPSAAAWGQEEGIESEQRFFDPWVCKHHRLGAEEREACELFKSLDRHGRYKAIVMQRLRRLNKPPVAAIEILQVLPRRMDVSAEGSTDEDGFPELHYFALEDADTGDVLAGPITTREPYASLETNQDLPENLRVRVVVEDDLRAIDTAEEIVALSATQCSNELFSCSGSGTLTCAPTKENNQFTTDDLLDAVQRCDRAITRSTQLTITARGGSGGRGANIWPSKGGRGGFGGGARMVTTLAEMDRVYKSPQDGTTYCYGLGQHADKAGAESGAGGASTLLRTCQNVSQSEITGVMLIAGGGSGGRAGTFIGDGQAGNRGGVTASSAGQSASDHGSGRGGNQGVGARGPGNDGKDGVGGKGGSSSWGTARWIQGNPAVSGHTGQGGARCSGAGAGGGGWGGGACITTSGNSGGGGSYAAAGLAAPSHPGSNDGHGSLIFVFAP